MLSRTQILQAIQAKDIQITPLDPTLLEVAKYEVTLGNTLFLPQPATQTIDLRRDFYPQFTPHQLDDQGYIFKPQTFLLGQTLQTVTLSSGYAAILDGRTKLAKLGISIYQSSIFCDPDRSNQLTLEMYNAGPYEVTLYPGLKVGALIFFQLDSHS